MYLRSLVSPLEKGVAKIALAVSMPLKIPIDSIVIYYDLMRWAGISEGFMGNIDFAIRCAQGDIQKYNNSGPWDRIRNYGTKLGAEEFLRYAKKSGRAEKRVEVTPESFKVSLLQLLLG